MTSINNLEPTLPTASSERGVTPEPREGPPQAYVAPRVVSHSGEGLLEELGPAQACYPFSSCGVTP